MIIKGDCLEILKTLEDNSVDSVVTDPPYGISFMGKKWDYDVPKVEVWNEVMRVLKPGGHALVACGTRTQHRMAVNIEDAGFEIRDIVAWIYGSGFPKSLNIGKAVDKLQGRNSKNEVEFVQWLKTNLNISYEEIDKAIGTKSQAFHYFAESDSNRQLPSNEHYQIIKMLLALDNEYDEFIFNKNKELQDIREVKGYEKAIKTWDIKYEKPILNTPVSDEAKQWEGWGTALKPAMELWTLARKPLSEKTVAENVLKWGTGGLNIDGSRVGTEDNRSRKNATEPGFMGGWGAKDTENNPLGRFPANLIHDGSEEVVEMFPNSKGFYRPNVKDKVYKQSGNLKMGGGNVSAQYDDSGSAARFFYCAKASKSERNQGLEDWEEVQTTDGVIRNNPESARKYQANSAPRKNHHPTVKPVSLMRYLVKLITPPKGTVLDPFTGSGSTGIAAKLEGFEFIGVEREEEYVKIAEARIAAIPSSLL